ncbi:MAG: hypothetical protein AAF092_05165 [Pseudomonadota bacterium]
MNPKFDLLGDPIPDNHGKAGANGHIATAENCNKVRLLLVAGVDQKQIAEELGVSVPTLTKHYFKSGSKAIKAARRRAVADERAKNILRLDAAAQKGNVSAIKELNSILADEAIRQRAADVQDGTEDSKPKKPEAPAPRGKKEKQVAAAEDAIATNDLLNPRVH